MKETVRALFVFLSWVASSAAQAQFTYSTNLDSSITITSYTGTNTAVVIPTTINGLSVTGIGDGVNSVFAGTVATFVTIPDSVTSIETNACAGSGLISVIVPGSVTTIGDTAFANCTSLINVYLNGNAPVAGVSVFENDNNATAYYLDGATGWTITDSSTNYAGLPAMDSTPQDQFSFTTNAGAITITEYTGPCCGPVIIPDSINGLLVTTIGTNAFDFGSSYEYYPQSVTIPGSIACIGDDAFAGNFVLNSVTIAYGVTSIGDSAFAGCDAMGSVSIPDGVTNIGPNAFNGTGIFGSITIPGSVISMGEGTFAGSMELSGVTIANGVTSIPDNAFLACQNLSSASIPDSVTNIGASAFQGTALGSIAIPGSVINIGMQAFNDCGNLGNVSIGYGVTSIGFWAFGASSVSSIAIPGSVTNIGVQAFQNCMFLSSATIANGVASIGTEAFFDCGNLDSITIPASVTNIGSGAFEDCYDLATAYFTGNAPAADSTVFENNVTDNITTVYYLPGTAGWSNPFAGVPAVLWNPMIQAYGADFGVKNNQFGFDITNASNFTGVVEACTNLASPVWIPLQTFTITNGLYYFSDPQWSNYPARYYGLAMP